MACGGNEPRQPIWHHIYFTVPLFFLNVFISIDLRIFLFGFFFEEAG